MSETESGRRAAFAVYDRQVIAQSTMKRDPPAPTRDQIMAGMEVARQLRERYRVTGVLLSAARAGYIAVLRCEMRYCFATAPDRFEPGTAAGPLPG